jgi:hypothetical protein
MVSTYHTTGVPSCLFISVVRTSLKPKGQKPWLEARAKLLAIANRGLHIIQKKTFTIGTKSEKGHRKDSAPNHLGELF